MLKLLGVHPLDETDLVTHGLELAHGLVIIEQANIRGREIALVEHLGNFLAFERSGAHDGSTVQASTDGNRMRRRRRFDGIVHDVCEASL